MTKRLYLDFDGVINVSRERKARPWIDDTGWATHKKARLFGHGDRWTIHYAPELVNVLNALADAGVEIVWCSTWQQDTKNFAQLGFQEFPWLSLHRRPASFRDPHMTPLDYDIKQHYVAEAFDATPLWNTKTTSILSHNSTCPATALWIDDELSAPDMTAAREHGVKTLTTSEWVGITPDMMQYIAQYFGIVLEI